MDKSLLRIKLRDVIDEYLNATEFDFESFDDYVEELIEFLEDKLDRLKVG